MPGIMIAVFLKKRSIMTTFDINYDNRTVTVEQLGKEHYKVLLPVKTLHLTLKQDNEGANHWFEDDTDNETPVTKALGEAIELHLMKKGDS